MASVLLKIKTKSGQHVINTLNETNTYNELKENISSLLKIPAQNISLLSGYPPKILECVDPTKTLAEVNIKSGDTLLVEEKEQPASMDNSPTHLEPSGHADGGLLMRQVVPADNSCLFTSVGFVLSGKLISFYVSIPKYSHAVA